MLSERQTRLIGYALIILAVLVQLQATIQIGGTAVRANAADIVLAALAPLILFALFSNFVRLTEIAGPRLLALIAATTLVLSFSLFRGYEVISEMSTWAAIKYTGWYILLYYLALGVLITIVSGAAGKERFTLGFVCFQVAVVVAFIAIEYAGYKLPFNEGGRLAGFAGNANAMAFYLICGIAFTLAYLRCSGLSSRRRIAVLIASALLLAGILFTKSIAGFIALVTILVFTIIIRITTLWRLAPVLVLGGVIWMALQVISVQQSRIENIVDKISGLIVEKIKLTTSESSLIKTTSESSLIKTTSESSLIKRNNAQYKATVQLRIEGYREALTMWQEHPVLGAGLGVHFHRQNQGEKPKNLRYQIHSTGLWLLAETGLAGLLLIVGIFVILFHKVWTLSRAPPDETGSDAWFQSAVLLILIGWAVAALFGELMYQRVGWLLVGMALTSPVQPLSFWKRVGGRR